MYTHELQPGEMYAVGTSRGVVPVFLLSRDQYVLTARRRSATFVRLEGRPQTADGQRTGLPVLALPVDAADLLTSDGDTTRPDLPPELAALLDEAQAPRALPTDLRAVPVLPRSAAVPTLTVVQARHITTTWAAHRRVELDEAQQRERERERQVAARDAVNATLDHLAAQVGLTVRYHPADLSGACHVDKAHLAEVLRALLENQAP